MKNRPWMKFYPASWLNDINLRNCSTSERGVLIDLMCHAHNSQEYGFFLDDYNETEVKKLAKCLSITYKTLDKCITNLIHMSRICRTDDNKLFIKRMVEENAYLLQQSDFGQKGGNPTLKGGHKAEETRREENIDIRECDFKTALPHWNMLAEKNGLAKIEKLTEKRKKKYRSRCREVGESSFWRTVETELPKLGDFARGGGNTSWKLDFDFLVNSDNNFTKFAEGKYRKETRRRVESNI